MVHVAQELEKAKLNFPLLIGGATTSKVHTAVKIDEHYKLGQTVHVLDASRSVTVAESLLGEKKEAFIDALRTDYDRLRIQHEKHLKAKKLISIDEARTNSLKLRFDNETIQEPKKLGITLVENVSIAELIDFIDWTPFFQTWELHGRYPNILRDDVVGTEAVKLFRDAQEMLDKIQKEKWMNPKGVLGLFPANAVGDDIEMEIHGAKCLCRS